jgi:GNAT superfamily N-acetyltransferase
MGSMSAPDPAPDLLRLLELWRAHDAAFERAEPAWWGAVVSDRRYPAIHEANYARVEARTPVRLAEIMAGPDACADPRWHVVVFHPEEQTDLLAEAGTAGARLAWDLVMVRRAGPTDRPGAGPDVPTEEIRRFDDAFWRAHAESVRMFDVEDDDTLDQLQALERETLIPYGRRWFVVRGQGGGPVAFASLLAIGDAAFLDHVVTFPDARRRGYAEALTRRAVTEAAAAGAAWTFLLAEPDRPAERIYRRIGFEPVGYLSSWTLDREP